MNANQRKLIMAMSLCAAITVPNIASAVSVSGQGTWETTLQGRDLDGNLSTFEAYYDTELNITWLADANYSQTSSYDDDGRMHWSAASAWALGLSINGYTAWRLPTVVDTGSPGCTVSFSGTDCDYNVDTSTGEMAHMFYSTLGNLAYYDTSGNYPQPGWGLSNTGPFTGLQSYGYWTDTLNAADPTTAWMFHFSPGYQSTNGAGTLYYGWAVHDGDIGASVVPMPAAAWLFGSGLIGLIAIARRQPS